MVYKSKFCGENIVGLILSLTRAVCCSSLETACCRWGRNSVFVARLLILCLHQSRETPACVCDLGTWAWGAAVSSRYWTVCGPANTWTLMFFYPAVLGLGEAFFNCFCQLFRALWLKCKECLATAITITTVSLRFVFSRKICLSVRSCLLCEIRYSTSLINFLFILELCVLCIK